MRERRFGVFQNYTEIHPLGQDVGLKIFFFIAISIKYPEAMKLSSSGQILYTALILQIQ